MLGSSGAPRCVIPQMQVRMRGRGGACDSEIEGNVLMNCGKIIVSFRIHLDRNLLRNRCSSQWIPERTKQCPNTGPMSLESPSKCSTVLYSACIADCFYDHKNVGNCLLYLISRRYMTHQPRILDSLNYCKMPGMPTLMQTCKASPSFEDGG